MDDSLQLTTLTGELVQCFALFQYLLSMITNQGKQRKKVGHKMDDKVLMDYVNGISYEKSKTTNVKARKYRRRQNSFQLTNDSTQQSRSGIDVCMT